MADSKISALPASTTPLAGTEVLPIVQSSTTVKVATNDLTVRNIRANATTGILQITGPVDASTRVATVPNANFTVARTDAAQSFTGDQTLSTGNLVVSSGKGIDFSATPGTGTSELLADYEEGTFTPTWNGGTVTVNSSNYTKVGRQVTWILDVVFGASVTVTNSQLTLPFTATGSWGGGPINFSDYNTTATVNVDSAANRLFLRSAMNAGNLNCIDVATKRLICVVSYFA